MKCEQRDREWLSDVCDPQSRRINKRKAALIRVNTDDMRSVFQMDLIT